MNGNERTDTEQIVDVTIAYCWALDEGEYDMLSSVFTADATALLGEPKDGLAEIIDRVSTALTPFRATQHMVTNHDVVVTGSTATCRCYLDAQHVSPSGNLYRVGGYYDDRLTHTEAGWRISHRELVVLWTDRTRANA